MPRRRRGGATAQSSGNTTTTTRGAETAAAPNTETAAAPNAAPPPPPPPPPASSAGEPEFTLAHKIGTLRLMAVCDPSLPTDIGTLRVKLATVPTLSQSVATVLAQYKDTLSPEQMATWLFNVECCGRRGVVSDEEVRAFANAAGVGDVMADFRLWSGLRERA